MEKHLYPALADELLRREGIPIQSDTEASETAMADMIDSDESLPFIEAVKPDSILLSRERQLLDRMKSQITRGTANETETFD